jgi:two-component system chemotaxis response regulator CheB
VRPSHVRLSRGPRINWSRPAIDPLFASAAKTYGSRVIGVLLTGRLNDGTAGLYEVKRHGGITIVQDPSDAISPGMPASALKHVAVDHCVALAAMPRILCQVCKDVVAREKEISLATGTGGPFHA